MEFRLLASLWRRSRALDRFISRSRNNRVSPLRISITLAAAAVSGLLIGLACNGKMADRPTRMSPPSTVEELRRAPLAKDERARAERLFATVEPLRAAFSPLGKPGPGDWLASHSEYGQTFAEYLASDPRRPLGARCIIYVQPVGDFTLAQQDVLDLTVRFIGDYFSCAVRVRPGIPLSCIPPSAIRTHPTWGMKQVLTTHVLKEVLLPDLPDDAAAMIALCPFDLWPGGGWNFVFGQADLRRGVGVWSMYRNGDPDGGVEERASYLLRTIKTASHELGHIFGIKHCTASACNMNGTNSREESDSRTVETCPECMAKVCWATRAEVRPRLDRLMKFCDGNGLQVEAEFYRVLIGRLAP